MVADGVFAAGIGLGTPTNRAWREAAIDEGVPQVLVMTGDPLFSDRAESPMQLGLVPIYQQEGAAFGELLAASGEDHKVAILSQNDDYGDGYVEGFKEAIGGADNIEVVGELTYEATDTSVDAQLTELAATGADVFFNAMSITPLVISSLQKAQQVGWLPSWFLPVEHVEPRRDPRAGWRAPPSPASTRCRSRSRRRAPPFQESEEGAAFLAAIDEYTNQEGVPGFPHCVWSWIAAATLEQAFEKMEEPTRESFMEALMSIQGFDAPFMLEGSTIDTTVDGRPAVSTWWCRSTTARATPLRSSSDERSGAVRMSSGAVRIAAALPEAAPTGRSGPLSRAGRAATGRVSPCRGARPTMPSRCERVAASAASGSRASSASMIAMCSGADCAARPGWYARRNWCRADCARSRSSSCVAVACRLRSRMRRSISWFSREYSIRLPAATAAEISSRRRAQLDGVGIREVLGGLARAQRLEADAHLDDLDGLVDADRAHARPAVGQRARRVPRWRGSAGPCARRRGMRRTAR